MDIKVYTIQTATNIPECISVPQLQQEMVQDAHWQWLKQYIIIGWPENRDQMAWDMRKYWMFCDDQCVVIPEIVKAQALDQLHVNDMEIEKTKLLGMSVSILA